MWPGGRICSNCALARKSSAQSALTAWIFAGGHGKLEGCSTTLELGGGMNKEHGVLYYCGTARRWPFLCLMSKIKPGLVATALFADCPAVIMAILWQIDHAYRSRKRDVQIWIKPLI